MVRVRVRFGVWLVLGSRVNKSSLLILISIPLILILTVACP